jgi:hypothetical protein
MVRRKYRLPVPARAARNHTAPVRSSSCDHFTTLETATPNRPTEPPHRTAPPPPGPSIPPEPPQQQAPEDQSNRPASFKTSLGKTQQGNHENQEREIPRESVKG